MTELLITWQDSHACFPSQYSASALAHCKINLEGCVADPEKSFTEFSSHLHHPSQSCLSLHDSVLANYSASLARVNPFIQNRTRKEACPRKASQRDHYLVFRYAIVSALAASALPSLVMARGHRISKVAEVPLVVDDGSENITKTSKAVALLKTVRVHSKIMFVKFSHMAFLATAHRRQSPFR